MTFDELEMSELRTICLNATVFSEAGIEYILLEGVKMPHGCSPDVSDALLCPTSAHGYNMRLFFPQKIESPKPLNWNLQVRILDRNWSAFSWQTTDPGLRPAQKVALIMRALRQ